MPTVNLTETIKLDDLLFQAEELQMNATQTIDFLAEALDIVKIKGKRVFSYSAPFVQTAPACQAGFVRSFVHTDWIDGESVVQAGENTLEEGFNLRFHRIEDDLDALAADVARAFVCLGEQRTALSKLLDELRVEINRINSDIHACCGTGSGGWTRPYYPFPYPGTYLPPDIAVPGPIDELPFGNAPLPGGGNWGGPVVNPYPGFYGTNFPGNYTTWGPKPGPFVSGGPTPFAPDVVDPLEHYMNVIKGMSTYAGPTAGIVRSTTDKTRAVVAGMNAKLIEETDLNGQLVEVWSTPAGIVMTPTGTGKAGPTGSRTGWTNPHLDLTGRFARWAADNDKTVREKLGAEFKLESFVKTFGEAKIEGGLTIAQVFDRMPGDLTVKSARGLVAPLADAAGKTVLREGYAAETVIGLVGMSSGGAGVGALAPTSVKTIPEDAAKGLMEAGVSNLGEMSAADPVKLADTLRRRGIAATPGEVASWQGQAMALNALDNLARGGGRFNG